MKHILIITLVLMSFISSPSWSETMDDLVQREGTYYKKFSDVPFTGQVEGKRQGSFKNGKQEGSWVGYHENGQLLNKGSFKNGLREGPWVGYWENGQLSSKGDYKNGKEEGSWVSYWNNGQLQYKGAYKNGLKEGSWVSYLDGGSVFIYLTGTFKDGVKISD
jgi:antitoxin component YwqK of YwqJK toxin-antitoxin module